jgi:hypothetical protein
MLREGIQLLQCNFRFCQMLMANTVRSRTVGSIRNLANTVRNPEVHGRK